MQSSRVLIHRFGTWGCNDRKHATIAIVGGTLVNADWSGRGTILIRDGKIGAVVDAAQRIPPHTDIVLDAQGKLVMPGGVDPHCHVENTIGSFTTRDDYAAASIAALHGGTTTIVDFAIPLPGQAPIDAVVQRRKMAQLSRCATALHGCVVEWDDTVPQQIHRMAEEGVRTIKLFTTYRDDVMANPDTVLHVMQSLKEISGMAYVHAEADHLIVEAQASGVRQHRMSAESHAATRPGIAEAAAVAEVLSIAESINAPVYFVHQTTGVAVDLVRAARRRGVHAYTETCPHYLSLDDALYAGPNPERFVCCPPLRSRDEVDKLMETLLRRDVETVGSDHCCFDTAQKLEKTQDVRQMPNGMPGVELRLPVTFSELVATGRLAPERFVALNSANPSRLNGLYPRKGVIAPGADADLVILDPAVTNRIKAAELHMLTDYSPYEDREVTGWPTIVISAGRIVINDGKFTDPGEIGEPLNASPFADQLLC